MKYTFHLPFNVAKENIQKLTNKELIVINGIELYTRTGDSLDPNNIGECDIYEPPQNYLDKLDEMSRKGDWIVIYDNESKIFEIYNLKNVDNYILYLNTYNK